MAQRGDGVAGLAEHAELLGAVGDVGNRAPADDIDRVAGLCGVAELYHIQAQGVAPENFLGGLAGIVTSQMLVEGVAGARGDQAEIEAGPVGAGE